MVFKRCTPLDWDKSASAVGTAVILAVLLVNIIPEAKNAVIGRNLGKI
jgi:hypothetical protein